MRELLTTLGELAGGAVLVAGVALVFIPAAVMLAGVLLVGTAYLASR